jgi:hypothetical protein
MYFNNYTSNPTTDFIGWFRMFDNPEIQKCCMHSTDKWAGNWTERLLEDLDKQDNRTSWGMRIPYEARKKSEFIDTGKFRGDHPWLPGCTVIQVNYKTFTLWLANSYVYPKFLQNA